MMQKIKKFEEAILKKDIPDFKPGDEVKVHIRIVDGEKERIQVFEGVVIARRNGGTSETFTVRKLSYGTGIEKTFPIHSPMISKLEVSKKGDVRRAKLFYMRKPKKI